MGDTILSYSYTGMFLNEKKERLPNINVKKLELGIPKRKRVPFQYETKFQCPSNTNLSKLFSSIFNIVSHCLMGPPSYNPGRDKSLTAGSKICYLLSSEKAPGDATL